MGNLGQLRRRDFGGFRPQGNAHNRYIVDAHGFDHRLHHAQILREPVIVAVDLVVQVEDGFFARNTDFKGHGQNGLTRLADGENIVHAFDFRQHLFGRNGDQLLHLTCAGTGEADKHVGESNVNLGFFFFRRHHDGEEAQQQTEQGQQRGDGRVLESLCGFSGNSERHDYSPCEPIAASWASASLTISSPALRPDRISTMPL